mmetsp:Transcript_29184/g.67179  ORF Transcript_29184/g.67179 Transcript_29184/m.67179 type:complete len:617 (+) Transcript_29184:31-1881(+)
MAQATKSVDALEWSLNLEAKQVEYTIVIPTKGRWRPACEISKEHRLKRDRRPFILVKTLALLASQGIDVSRVVLWTSDEYEQSKYKEALSSDEVWKDVSIEVGVDGIMHQRNYIVRWYPEGKYLVSMDDDLSDILMKRAPGSEKFCPMPQGLLEQLIHHAHSVMTKHRAFIWGLNSTLTNILCTSCDGISTCNGEINGFCYGFINRYDEELLPQLADAIEDAERSVRYFKKDKIVLRYRMFVGSTKCLLNARGLQESFGSGTVKQQAARRKEIEYEAAGKLRDLFPELIKPPASNRRQSLALAVSFRAKGKGGILPTSTDSRLEKAMAAEKYIEQAKAVERKRVREEREAAGLDPLVSKKRRTTEPPLTAAGPAENGTGVQNAAAQSGVVRKLWRGSSRRSISSRTSSESSTRASSREVWSPHIKDVEPPFVLAEELPEEPELEVPVAACELEIDSCLEDTQPAPSSELEQVLAKGTPPAIEAPELEVPQPELEKDINGMEEDNPIGAALKASLYTAAAEQRLIRRESLLLDRTLRMSVGSTVPEDDESDATVPDCDLDTQIDLDEQVVTLMSMGFCEIDVRHAVVDAKGDMASAAVMLASSAEAATKMVDLVELD